ncbi:MAG: hypothetical protein R6U57_04630 [Anaerolineales bacterium]
MCEYEPVAYLIYLLILGMILVRMIRQNETRADGEDDPSRWLVWAVAVLVIGDTFHLLTLAEEGQFGVHPIFQSSDGHNITWTGVGTFASSFTLTLFYSFLLFYTRGMKDQPWSGLELTIAGFLCARFILILFPDNWGVGATDLWRVIRNIPFFVGGVGISLLFFQEARTGPVKPARWMGLAGLSIIFSFIFYLGSLLSAGNPFWVRMQMAAKSVCYLFMAFSLSEIGVMSPGAQEPMGPMK